MSNTPPATRTQYLPDPAPVSGSDEDAEAPTLEVAALVVGVTTAVGTVVGAEGVLVVGADAPARDPQNARVSPEEPGQCGLTTEPEA